MRFRLSTLLIVLALGPPVLAWGWNGYRAHVRARELAALEDAIEKYKFGHGDYPPSRISVSSNGSGVR
jgi:hypothetical protein